MVTGIGSISQRLKVIIAVSVLFFFGAAGWSQNEFRVNQIAKITASDGQPGDLFGRALDIDGDTIITGAWRNDEQGVNAGAAYIFERGNVDWNEVQKLVASDGANGDFFGFSVAVSGSTAVVGAFVSDASGHDAGAAYVFERDHGGDGNWGEIARLAATDAADNDFFGRAVAISHDTVVVGADGNDDHGPGSGSAYVFDRNSGGANAWGLVKKLTSNDGVEGDAFGRAVAIDGDTIVIGAYLDDDGAENAGSAYIFERNATEMNAWGQTAKISAATPLRSGFFGFDVAIDGDRMLVGAFQSESAGALYIFEKQTDWVETFSVVEREGAETQFGWSVDIAGDLAVTGVPRWDGQNSGVAFVYQPNTDADPSWLGAETLGANPFGFVDESTTNDEFGIAVAVDSDLIAVGSHGDDDLGADAGAIYIFRTNTITNSAPVVDPAGEEDMPDIVEDDVQNSGVRIGELISGIGGDGATDADGDALGIALIATTGTGGIWQYRTSDDALWQDVSIFAPMESKALLLHNRSHIRLVPNMDFHGAITDALQFRIWDQTAGTTGQSGDTTVNGGTSAFSTATAGARITVLPDNDAPRLNDPAETVVRENVEHIISADRMTASDPEGEGPGSIQFEIVDPPRKGVLRRNGVVLGTASRFTQQDIIDGLIRYQSNANTGGTDHVRFTLHDSSNAASPVLTFEIQIVLNPTSELRGDMTDTALFGSDVAIDGDLMVVGAANDGTGGAAYIYQRDGNQTWSEIARLTADDGATDDGFGFSVDIDSDTVVVGAPRDHANGARSGSAYVFQHADGTPATWSQITKLTRAAGAVNEQFGDAVAVSGDTIVIGAPGDSEFGIASGAVYTYERDFGGIDAWGQADKLDRSDITTLRFVGDDVDIDGDTIAVGSDGAALIFERNAGAPDNWGRTRVIVAQDNQAIRFGFSIALDDNEVIVGSYTNNRDGIGTAYIHARDEGGADMWGELVSLRGAGTGENEFFGFSVSISGDVAVVGSFLNAAVHGGKPSPIYLFERNSDGVGAWGEITDRVRFEATPEFIAPVVAVDGTTLAVGVAENTNNSLETGAVYTWSLAINTAPVLDTSNDVELDAIQEDDRENNGVSAADIIDRTGGGTFDADGDELGILLVDADSSNGSWEFQHIPGGEWSEFSLDAASALALTPMARLRFIPDENFAGTVVDAIVFRLWDQTSASTGIIMHDQEGGLSSPFSVTTESAGITVTPENDPPVAVTVLSFSAAHEQTIDIGPARLAWDDVEPTSTDLIVYTLNGEPALGDLTRNSVVLHTTDQFTQQDVNENRIQFVANTGMRGTDLINMSVSDSAGGSAPFTLVVNVGFDISNELLTQEIFTFLSTVSLAVAGDTLAAFDTTAQSLSSERGKLRIFDRDEGGADSWGEVADAAAPVAVFTTQRFDRILAITPDVAVAGIPTDLVNGFSAGSIQIFERGQDDTWTQTAERRPDDGATGDLFGSSVDICSGTIVAGAPFVDSTAPNTGAVYVYERTAGDSGPWEQVKKITPVQIGDDDLEQDRFGVSVAISGDTIAVGSLLDDVNAISSGSVYVFDRNQDGPDEWGLVKKIAVADGAFDDRFGATLAIHGDILTVGAPGRDVNDVSAGAAYVYHRNLGGADNWGPASQLLPEEPVAMREFGHDIQVSGDTIVIGTDVIEPTSRSGVRVVFERDPAAPTTWREIGQLNGGDGHLVNDAAVSAAISGDTAAIHGATLVEGTSMRKTYIVNLNATDNSAPVIDNSVSPQLTAIDEDTSDNAGTRTQDLLTALAGDGVTDGDGDIVGMAVIAVDDSNGRWQYQEQDTGGWLNFGFVSTNVARVLDPTARIRFVPDPDFNGLVAPGITFHAWDQSRYPNGSTASALHSGGNSPFSVATATAGIMVNSVDDPPRFTSTPDTIAQTLELYQYAITVDVNGASQISIVADQLPSWLVFQDNGDGSALLHGTVAPSDIGSHSVRLIATGNLVAEAGVQEFSIFVLDNDTDGDGLSDLWEIEHFGDRSAQPNGNPDGDRLTNRLEFALDRDPRTADANLDVIEVDQGWNLIALPGPAVNPTPNAVFAPAMPRSLWSWSGENHAVADPDQAMDHRRGYWAFFNQSHIFPVDLAPATNP